MKGNNDGDMAANGPITGIQRHFNLYRVREIKTQRNVCAAKWEENEGDKAVTSDEDDGEGGKKWIPPKIEAEQYRPRVPLPINIKTVVYSPDDAGLQRLINHRKGLIGSQMRHPDALSETYIGIFYDSI